MDRSDLMIDIYESMQDKDGVNINGRTKLFIQKTDDDGEIILCNYGTLYTPLESGTMFIVDDWLINQLDKVVFKDGTLQVKDGEQLDEPVKSEKEKQREELLRQLALLDADIEEVTDEP